MKIVKNIFNFIIITISIFLIVFNGIILYNRVALKKDLLNFGGYSLLVVVSRQYGARNIS